MRRKLKILETRLVLLFSFFLFCFSSEYAFWWCGRFCFSLLPFLVGPVVMTDRRLKNFKTYELWDRGNRQTLSILTWRCLFEYYKVCIERNSSHPSSQPVQQCQWGLDPTRLSNQSFQIKYIIFSELLSNLVCNLECTLMSLYLCYMPKDKKILYKEYKISHRLENVLFINRSLERSVSTGGEEWDLLQGGQEILLSYSLYRLWGPESPVHWTQGLSFRSQMPST